MKERQSEMGKIPSDVGRNEVRVFENAQFGQVRTTQGASGEPLFCLADVCKALSIANPRNIVKRLTSRGVHSVDTPTYNQHGTLVMQEMNFIDEPNLFRCIFQSRKEEAELFQDWVCEEVLPSIRKTGGYIDTHQEDTPELIMIRALEVAQSAIERHRQMLEQAKERIILQEREIKAQAPKVKYVDDVLQSVNTYTSTQISKELGLREAEQLHKILKEKGILFKQSGQWMLTAKYCGMGYTKSRTHQYTRSDGSVCTSTTTVWTEKGRAFLHTILDSAK